MSSKKTLEDALAEMEAKKSQLAEYSASHAKEIQAENAKISAFNKRLDALTQSERRQVLDAAGLKHISAAPRPIDPIRASRSIPPKLPLDLVAMAEQQNSEQLERERKQARELDAMRMPGDGGGSFRMQWLPTESQQPAPEQTPAAPVVATACDGLSIPKSKRPDLLTPLIEKAQRDESDPFSAAVIWPKLCDMAERKTTPFIGKTESGLKWIDANDSPKFLTKEALGDRLRRVKRRDRARKTAIGRDRTR